MQPLQACSARLATARKGLDHLLPPGLGPEGHLEQAVGLPSPFQVEPPADEEDVGEFGNGDKAPEEEEKDDAIDGARACSDIE